MKLSRLSVKGRYVLPISVGATMVCVFVLPLHFPPPHPVLSQAYVVGYNNRVALISVVLISILVASLSLGEERPALRSFHDEQKVGLSWLAGALFLVAAWNGTLSWIVFAAHSYGVEDYYFLPQLEKFYFLHRHLYRDIEFAYGPLLFYPPVWVHCLLAPFHVSVRACYYAVLVFHHLVGVGMLFFVVNRLPMSRAMRLAAFAIVTLFSFTPALGPNYTLLRYVLPIFCFVLFSAVELPVVAAVAAAAAQTLMWTDSSEQAIAFGLAVVVSCCYRTWRQRVLWMVPIGGVVVGTVLYFAFVDPSVLSSLIYMSRGVGNQVPERSLETVTLLTATVWIVPRLIARHVAQSTPETGLLIGLYALGLGLLPVSLGSSGIVRIVGGSSVLFLLSLVAAGESKLPDRRLWTAAVAATYLVMVLRWYWEASNRFYPDISCIDERIKPADGILPARLRARLLAFEQKWPCAEQPLEFPALQVAIGDAPFAAPYHVPEIVEGMLPQLPNFVPSYWAGTINIWDAEMEKRKVEELRQVQWALLRWHPEAEPVSPNWYAPFGLETHYRVVHPILAGDLLANEINQNWTLAGHIGDYLLYRRVR